jgi:GAF domain-containing protein
VNLLDNSRLQKPVSQLLENFLNDQNFETIIAQVLPVLGEQWQCDRVFLYLRSPELQIGKVPFCWRRTSAVLEVHDPDWKPELRSLAEQDPLFEAALKAQPSIFIDDVEAAHPETLNRNFERKTFGHRSLIHAHLCSERKLWGILQACIFNTPHHWSRYDRQLTERAVAWLTPVAMEYVSSHLPAYAK